MRILIVEDEPIIARRIQRMLRKLLEHQIQSLQLCHSVPSGLAYLDKHEIDLLFLDLNLHGEDGFSLLESLLSAAFHTIIISAYKEKAIQAFEYGVLDFVPKPFNEERLAKALKRLDQVNLHSEASARFLIVQKKGKHELMEVEQLSYIKGAGTYSELFFQNGKKEIHNKNLEKLNQLLPAHFDRIHKSYIVNSHLLKELIAQSGSKYSLVLKDETTLPVGRTRYKELKEKWGI